jgi:prepilin-type N-terminal cleavage/methylation domain-containing protein
MTIESPIVRPLRNRGVTIVELLLVISVLVILISFAVPGIDRATARAEIMAATEHVQYSIDTARRLARLSESSVNLHADPASGVTTQRIRLSGPRLDENMGAQEYRLPKDIRLVPDQAVFTFDKRGLVRNPGRIVLVSQADEAISFELRVE